MACLWSGAIAALKKIIRDKTLIRHLTGGVETNASSELTAWENSLTALMNALAASEFDDLQALIELNMPTGAERADVILLGGSPVDRRGYVLELKQWSEVSFNSETREVIVPHLGSLQHPSQQALNYRGKLRLFHSRAASYALKAAVFLHNLDDSSKKKLETAIDAELVREAPLFGKEDRHAFAQSIRDHLLPCHLEIDEHRVFSAAPYEQTRHLFAVLRNRASDIANRATMALAEAGIGLTSEQDHLVEEILLAMRKRAPKVFIVQGGPGSGKTLLAVALLLRALREGRRGALAIRNNRLQAILRKCFDAAYPGASGALMFFEPKTGLGIGHQHFSGQFDLVICDEAQRMEARIMPTVLSRAPVSAIFLDETQRLNLAEQGATAAFSSASRQVNRAPEPRQLLGVMRCRGGQLYHDFVESLLAKPAEVLRLKLSQQQWRERYLFAVYDSAPQLLAKMRELKASRADSRVAIVASFTESPGSRHNANAPGNLRVGYPLASGWNFYRGAKLSIRWLMKPDDYVRFWLHGKSNDLDRAASIYGAQGFESDYVGVIWGRDLVLRNQQWALGDPNLCYDTIDGLVSAGRNRRWTNEALELVRNRYRIFLTRGIKGTLIFCEDAETREFLLGLQK
jgi:DUF2075 family protein